MSARLYIVANLNNKFGYAVTADTFEALQAWLVAAEEAPHWRRIGSNSWHLLRRHENGELRPYKQVFAYEPRRVEDAWMPAGAAK